MLHCGPYSFPLHSKYMRSYIYAYLFVWWKGNDAAAVVPPFDLRRDILTRLKRGSPPASSYNIRFI